MSSLKCIVVDDEPVAKQLMSSYVVRTSFLELSGSFEDSAKALNHLQTHNTDILISDINMPGINGLEMIQTLVKRPAIIFATAHRNFAVEGFENGVTDYLMKPVTYERFLKAITKARLLISMLGKGQVSSHEQDPFMFFRVDGAMVKIMINDILSIEGLADYLKIVTSQKNYITLGTLKGIEKQLASKGFLRVQRSFVVNLKAISSITGNLITLNNGQKISIAPSKKERLFNLLGI